MHISSFSSYEFRSDHFSLLVEQHLHLHTHFSFTMNVEIKKGKLMYKFSGNRSTVLKLLQRHRFTPQVRGKKLTVTIDVENQRKYERINSKVSENRGTVSEGVTSKFSNAESSKDTETSNKSKNNKADFFKKYNQLNKIWLKSTELRKNSMLKEKADEGLDGPVHTPKHNLRSFGEICTSQENRDGDDFDMLYETLLIEHEDPSNYFIGNRELDPEHKNKSGFYDNSTFNGLQSVTSEDIQDHVQSTCNTEQTSQSDNVKKSCDIMNGTETDSVTHIDGQVNISIENRQIIRDQKKNNNGNKLSCEETISRPLSQGSKLHSKGKGNKEDEFSCEEHMSELQEQRSSIADDTSCMEVRKLSIEKYRSDMEERKPLTCSREESISVKEKKGKSSSGHCMSPVKKKSLRTKNMCCDEDDNLLKEVSRSTCKGSGSLNENNSSSKVDNQTFPSKNIPSGKGNAVRRKRPYFRCSLCNKAFQQISYLKKHLKCHCNNTSHESKFECEICNKKFRQILSLEDHVNIHTGDKPWKCEGCGKSFHSRDFLKSHKCTRQDVRNRKLCPICGKHVIKNYYDRHIATVHEGERPFKCPKCCSFYGSRGHLNRHLKSHERGTCNQPNWFNASKDKREYHCDTCNKVFEEKRYLIRHMVSHSQERMFKCSECTKSYRYKQNLVRHKLKHQGGPFIHCGICQDKFYDSTGLKKHLSSYHTGVLKMESKVDCEVCDKQFHSYATFIRHMSKMHPGVKVQKYICDLCNRSHDNQKDYEIHLKEHRTSAYKCRTCAKCFPTKSQLKTHLLRGHGNKNKMKRENLNIDAYLEGK